MIVRINVVLKRTVVFTDQLMRGSHLQSLSELYYVS